MIEQLKQALSASSIDFERRQKTRSEKKPFTNQLTESQNRLASMDQEISLYKDKLAQLNHIKANQSHYGVENGRRGSGDHMSNSSFYLKPDNVGSMSNGAIDSLGENQPPANVVKVVKVSRKDLRRLTDEEVLKRSINKK